MLRSVVLADKGGVMLAPACCMFGVCGMRRSTACVPLRLGYSVVSMHSGHEVPVIDTATSGSPGNGVRVSVSGMSTSGTRRIAVGLSKAGTGGTINRVLASAGLASCGSFRGPSGIGPIPFGRMGVGGSVLGVGLPTGSVIAVRLRWGCHTPRGVDWVHLMSF